MAGPHLTNCGLVLPHPLQSPPPQGGDRHLAQKACFFRLHWNWSWGGPSLGDPPSPHGGDQPDNRRWMTRGIYGQGDYNGGVGYGSQVPPPPFVLAMPLSKLQ